MRIILFFDLPSTTKKERREYSKFMKVLDKKGFAMLQESVYTKLALNQNVVNSVLKELKEKVPPDGLISVLTITEQQFSTIQHILGDIETEQILDDNKLVKL